MNSGAFNCKSIVESAIGTPCASINATLFLGYHEWKIILSKYKNNLLLYQRQIDNILIIWVPTSDNDKEWDKCVTDLNHCSFLNWETENPGTKHTSWTSTSESTHPQEK